ncbi:MAG: phosphate/phosphite/phosphonate ABC transporter substrate-binding protein [Culicoidibacterales bacterium]
MKKQIISALTLTFVIGVILAGCGTEKTALTMIWYPNESGVEFEGARKTISREIEKATGKKVENTLTTDYNIAIEAIAGGKADLAFMGASGYVQANKKNPKVLPLVIPSGQSGTKADAYYYSWLTVPTEKKEDYQSNGRYTIDNIKGKNFAFVAPSSTSGFTIPATEISSYFNLNNNESLIEPGSFFKKVLFGGTHQGTIISMLNNDADIAAVCDTCLEAYVDLDEGEKNTIGTQYSIKKDAVEPFNKVRGRQFSLIASMPVLNSPFVVNTETIDINDQDKILEVLLSDTINNTKEIWKDRSDKTTKALNTKQTTGQRYITITDSWFDRLRK